MKYFFITLTVAASTVVASAFFLGVLSNPKPDTFAGIDCEEIHNKVMSNQYFGACYVDFWNDYKACYGTVPFAYTGCVLRIVETEEDVKPECYAKNCPEQYTSTL